MKLNEILIEQQIVVERVVRSGTFKTVPDWDKYEVSTTGVVRNKETKKEVAQWKHTGKGTTYKRVTLRQDGRRKNWRVHRLVATVFIPNPKGLAEVDHKDGDAFNNKKSNLEWVAGEENIQRRTTRHREQKKAA